MYDLLYVDPTERKRLEADLLYVWPNAVLTDASDYLHQDRIEFECNGIDTLSYYTELIDMGAYDLSFSFSLAMYEDKETVEQAIECFKTRNATRNANIEASLLVPARLG